MDKLNEATEKYAKLEQDYNILQWSYDALFTKFEQLQQEQASNTLRLDKEELALLKKLVHKYIEDAKPKIVEKEELVYSLYNKLQILTVSLGLTKEEIEGET